MKSRAESLRTSILGEQTFLINNSLLSSGSMNNKERALRIEKLSEGKKDFLAECFIQLAKFDFRAAFLTWYRDNKIDDDDPEREAKVASAGQGVAQARMMQKELTEYFAADNLALLEKIRRVAEKPQRAKK